MERQQSQPPDNIYVVPPQGNGILTSANWSRPSTSAATSENYTPQLMPPLPPPQPPPPQNPFRNENPSNPGSTSQMQTYNNGSTCPPNCSACIASRQQYGMPYNQPKTAEGFTRIRKRTVFNSGPDIRFRTADCESLSYEFSSKLQKIEETAFKELDSKDKSIQRLNRSVTYFQKKLNTQAAENQRLSHMVGGLKQEICEMKKREIGWIKENKMHKEINEKCHSVICNLRAALNTATSASGGTSMKAVVETGVNTTDNSFIKMDELKGTIDRLEEENKEFRKKVKESEEEIRQLKSTLGLITVDKVDSDREVQGYKDQIKDLKEQLEKQKALLVAKQRGRPRKILEKQTAVKEKAGVSHKKIEKKPSSSTCTSNAINEQDEGKTVEKLKPFKEELDTPNDGSTINASPQWEELKQKLENEGFWDVGNKGEKRKLGGSKDKDAGPT